MCPLTLHALLHIADGIEACGPVWTYWAFPMECYCSVLQRAVARSRRYPYKTLNHFVTEDAILQTVKLRYNLWDKLSLKPKSSKSNHEVAIDINTDSGSSCTYVYLNIYQIIFSDKNDL